MVPPLGVHKKIFALLLGVDKRLLAPLGPRALALLAPRVSGVDKKLLAPLSPRVLSVDRSLLASLLDVV